MAMLRVREVELVEVAGMIMLIKDLVVDEGFAETGSMK
jgi:hypothetical protein